MNPTSLISRSPRLLRSALALATVAVLASGCANMSEREQGTAKGAGIGAVAGAVIGSATGGSAGQSALIGGALGALAGNLWSKNLEDKRRALESASAGTGVEVVRTNDDRLKLNVPSDVSFDTGRADIKPQMRPVLDEIGRNLDPNVRVTIVGHTDDTGGDAINGPLSMQRAMAVRDYLAARNIPTSRVNVEGRGSREPVASNSSESGRAANRRVEIFLAERSS